MNEPTVDFEKPTKKEPIRKETSPVIIAAVVIIIGLAAMGLQQWLGTSNSEIATPPQKPLSLGTPAQTISSAAIISDGFQEITLSWGKFNYNPEVITVKKGVPVKIKADTERLLGCFRSLQIPELGVQKTFTEADPIIEFTPDKVGTFAFGCAMGMGNGRLVVS